jgi:hypothetical protein
VSMVGMKQATLSASRFTFSISDNFYHTLCIYIGCDDGMSVFMVKSSII